MPHPDDMSEPLTEQEIPCYSCETRGCVKCGFLGFRAMTPKEEAQYRAEMRNPERA